MELLETHKHTYTYKGNEIDRERKIENSLGRKGLINPKFGQSVED